MVFERLFASAVVLKRELTCVVSECGVDVPGAPS